MHHAAVQEAVKGGQVAHRQVKQRSVTEARADETADAETGSNGVSDMQVSFRPQPENERMALIVLRACSAVTFRHCAGTG